MMNDVQRLLGIGLTWTALLFLSAAVVGCQDKPTPAPQSAEPEKIVPASTPTKKPPLPPAEGAEMLTPTEMRAVQKIYEAQARQTINPQNAETITDALAREIEADIASQTKPATQPH